METKLKKPVIPAELVEKYFQPAFDAYSGEKGEYWQMYHCFLKGCKASGLEPRSELPLLLPAIKQQQAFRQENSGKVFIAAWRNFQGWLSSAYWHWQPPEVEDPILAGCPTSEQLEDYIDKHLPHLSLKKT